MHAKKAELVLLTIVIPLILVVLIMFLTRGK